MLLKASGRAIAAVEYILGKKPATVTGVEA